MALVLYSQENGQILHHVEQNGSDLFKKVYPFQKFQASGSITENSLIFRRIQAIILFPAKEVFFNLSVIIRNMVLTIGQ